MAQDASWGRETGTQSIHHSDRGFEPLESELYGGQVVVFAGTSLFESGGTLEITHGDRGKVVMERMAMMLGRSVGSERG